MKLFEDLPGKGTIQDAIKNMVNKLFNVELDDDKVDKMSHNISLSDLLALDTAYSNDDVKSVQDILGPLPQLEYNMGASNQTTSAASSRPTPARRNATNVQQPNNNNSSSSNQKYSSGVQNGVTSVHLPKDDNDSNDNNDDDGSDTDKNSNNQSDDNKMNENNKMQMIRWLKHRAGVE